MSEEPQVEEAPPAGDVASPSEPVDENIELPELRRQLQEAEQIRVQLQAQLDAQAITIEQQAAAIEHHKLEATRQDEAAVAALASSKMQLDRTRRELEEQRRELEATVVRYAVSEQSVLKARAEAQSSDRKAQEAKKEAEAANKRAKAATVDRAKAEKDFDIKCMEVTTALREKERLRDELHGKEVKLKWAHNRITQEMEAHRETQEKLDKVSGSVQQVQDEAEAAKRDAAASITAFRQQHQEKMQSLESQVHELKAQLIVAQSNEDCRKAEQRDADEQSAKMKALEDEIGTLRGKVMTLEVERKELRQRVDELQESENQRAVLEIEVGQLRIEVERLRTETDVAATDAAAWRSKESELLGYTQQLTDRLVAVQSEATAAANRAQLLEDEQQPLADRAKQLDSQLADVRRQLEAEQAARRNEVALLTRKVAEKQEAAERAAGRLEEAEAECAVLRRKQQQGTKELTRELQQCRRRLEQLEAGSNSSAEQLEARSDSSSSLDEPGGGSSGGTTNGVEPQLLITHIGKLQSRNSKLNEKVEFLEEHTRTLLLEVQRKGKLVQELVLRQETGALSSNRHDLNKLEAMRHGGAMASVYSSQDEGISLQLSLEINRKLQAVLEETLIKNITLKENLDTLGQEIARLSARLAAAERRPIEKTPTVN